MNKSNHNRSTSADKPFLKKFIFKKILWTVIVLLIVGVINVLLNKYAGEYFNDIAERVSGNYTLTGLVFFISEISLGIFPAELFMMIYQGKGWSEYFWIVLILGIISSFCGFVAFLAGRYLGEARLAKMLVLQKKFKTYADLFLKYGWVILILAATTPLPFAMISFIAGYFKFSPVTFLKIVLPVRVLRFFLSAWFIKYSITLL